MQKAFSTSEYQLFFKGFGNLEVPVKWKPAIFLDISKTSVIVSHSI